MTEQERLDEILRMTERYKMDEARRRLSMVEAAEMGPSDEYAYADQAQPPVQNAASMVPRGMGEQYGPIQMPGMLDPRLGPQIPQGYTEDEEGRILDPNRNPAWFQAPSRKDIAWDALTGALPSVGSALAMGATKGVGTGAHYAEPVVNLARDYQDSIGEYVRRSGEALGRGVTAARDLGRRVGEWGKTPITGQQAATAARIGAEVLPGAGFVEGAKDTQEAAAAFREGNYPQAGVSAFKSLANPILEIATAGTAGLMKKGAKAAIETGADVARGVGMMRGGLPMDEASRMARAKEQGFNTDVFRGHNLDPNAPHPTALRLSPELDDFPIGGISTTHDPDTAGYFAAYPRGGLLNATEPDLTGASIMPLKLRGDYPHLFDFADDFERQTGKAFHDASDAELHAYAKKHNIAGVRADENDEVRVFDPKNIRSRFAAFDPAKTDSDDLLAMQPKVTSRDPTGRPLTRRPLSETEKSPDEILAAIDERLKATRGGSSTPPMTGSPAINSALGSGPIKPIRAYHGSPHDFDKFDLSKIGTGEGAQAYGHGLYFAENEGVARSYRDALGPQGSFDAIDSFLQANSRKGLGAQEIKATLEADPRLAPLANDPKAVNALRGLLPDYAPNEAVTGTALQHYRYLNDAVEKAVPGRMYEVAIHADPQRFLDWDKPLSAQGAAGEFGQRYLPPEMTGKDLVNVLGGNPESGNKRMLEAGIPGIKYLDAGSRGAAEGSRNYVLFDDKIVEILKKYGVASIAALPPAVQAAIQMSRPPEREKAEF